MKKLLALVLAMVMTLGLATVGAGAAYSDEADIDYKEAVDVMTAIQVFDGMDGAFNPDGTLTREQGAKIIAYMILGKKAADSLTTAKSSFTDVAADRWSAGAIEYAVSEGIIGGRGDGTFDPAGELTGYAFAKMCLVALGYNAQYEGFVGADWQINVGKTAASANLNKDLNIVMSQGISRQEACQMSLNTLKGDMVEYENPINVKGGDGMEVTVGAKRSYTELDNVTYNYDGGAEDRMQFVERYYRDPDLTLVKNAEDDFGRPANQWKLGNKSVGKFAKTPTVTYTAGVKGGAVYTDLGGSSIDWDGMMTDANNVRTALVTIKANGTDLLAAGTVGIASTYGSKLNTIITRGNTTDSLPGSGNGVKTEIYYDRADNTLSIIQTTTFLAKAQSDYNTSTKKIVIQTDSIAFAAVNSLSSEDFPVVEGAKKDDYFYITVYGNDNDSVATVEKVPASAFVPNVKVSAYKGSDNVTADGTTYDLSAQGKSADCASKAANGIVGGWTLQSVAYDLILDPYGYVLAADTTDVSNALVDNYLFVSDVARNGFNVTAKIVKMDGSDSTVTIKKVGSLTMSSSAYVIDAGGGVSNGTAATYTVAEAIAAGGNNGWANTLAAGAFYRYTTSNNDYTLTYVNSYTTGAAITIAPSNPNLIAGTRANNKTVLIQDDQVVVGVANFPKEPGTHTVAYMLDKDATTVLAIYKPTASQGSTGSSKYIYLFNGVTQAKDSTSSDIYYTYDAFVDGAKVTGVAVNSNDYATGGLLKVNTNTKGQYVADNNTYVSTNEANVYTVDTGAVGYSGGNVIVNGTAYVPTSDAVVNYIDCYNTGSSVQYSSVSALNGLTGNYRVVLIQKAVDDASVKEIWVITNRGAGLDW